MALGNEILLTAIEPQGVDIEGIISGTPKPGTVMQIKASTEPVGGVFTWEVYNQAADGNRSLIAVLLPDALQGKCATDAYVTGSRGFLYMPAAGEQLNMILQDVSGTGDTHAIGERLIVDDGTGTLIATTGTPESEPFILLETLAAPTADGLARCMFTGY
jgi:hypothetical protein